MESQVIARFTDTEQHPVWTTVLR